MIDEPAVTGIITVFKWIGAFAASLFGAGLSIGLKEESEKIELTNKMRMFYLFGGGTLSFFGANAAYQYFKLDPLSFIGIFGIIILAVFGMGLCLVITQQIAKQVPLAIDALRKRFIGGE